MADSQDRLRTPPHNEEAERNLLGSIFLDNRVLDRTAGEISHEDFYFESHRHIYQAMVELHKRREVIDTVTLRDMLEAKGLIESIGYTYINALTQDVPSAAHSDYYAQIVTRRSKIRDFISTAGSLIDEAYRGISDFEAFMSRADARLARATRISDHAKEVLHIEHGATAAMALLKERLSNGDSLLGLSTGIRALDRLTGGLINSRLWVIGGRPGMGKTALATTIQANLAKQNIPSVYLSLEMDGVQFAMRHLALEAKIDSQKFLTLDLTKKDLKALEDALATLQTRPILYQDRSGLTSAEVCQIVRTAHREYGIKVAFVDFIQLVASASSGRDSQRRLELKAIIYSLKELAKELDIPVVGLSQMNRNVESRISKRPMISDLEESGAIEQAADVIAFPYRDHVYNPEADESEGEGIIRKARDGRTGTAPLRWVGKYTTYTDVAPEAYDEMADQEHFTEVSYYGPGDLKK